MRDSTVNSVARRLGFEVVAQWRLPRLAYTRRLQELFAHLGIMSIIDVGANAGQFRDQMRDEVGFTGPIYSFEPDPTLAAVLARPAASDPAWTVFPCALGATAGMMAFNIMDNPVYNSFHVPDTEEASHAANGNRVVRTVDVEVRTVDVEVRTLDAAAASIPDLAHAFLKIDTQGFDLEVLKGGDAVVRQIPALQTEVALKQLYSGRPSMQESITAFGKLGFAVADLFLVSTDGGHRAVEFDCIMVRAVQRCRIGCTEPTPPHM